MVCICCYFWSISARVRNANASHTSGNPKSTVGIPPCVAVLMGHDLYRSRVCVLCDEYLGRSAWRTKSCVSLLNHPKYVDRVKHVFAEFSLDSRYLSTSLCVACLTTIYHEHDIEHSLHLTQHKEVLRARLRQGEANRNIPPCERFPVGICFLCEHCKTWSSRKRGRPVSRKRRVDECKTSGRPPKVRCSSVRHNANRGGGRPMASPDSFQPHHTKMSAKQFYTASHALIISLSESVMKSPSIRGSERVVSTLRQFDIHIESGMHKINRGRIHVFDKYFVSIPPPDCFEPLPKCLSMSTKCPPPPSTSDIDSKESKSNISCKKSPPVPCVTCRHPLVICKDIVAFLKEYVRLRGHSCDDVGLLKVGLDGGGKSLKFMVQILFKDDPLLVTGDLLEEMSQRVGATELDSGVSRVLIIALAPCLSEYYTSVNHILELLHLDLLYSVFRTARFAICVDLKMQMILLGLKGCSARFGCPYCLFSRWSDHSHPSTHRTIVRLTSEATSLSQKITQNKRLKPGEGESSLGVPPVSFLRRYEPVLKVICPPQLHLNLGIIPTFYNQIAFLDPDIAHKWLTHCNISLNPNHGETDFIGPECMKLLRSLDDVEKMVPLRVRNLFKSQEENFERLRVRDEFVSPTPHSKRDKPTTTTECQLLLLLCVKALRAYEVVVRMTMKSGADMRKDWQTPLREFTSLITRTQVKVTIKIHILSDGHFNDFLTQFAGGVSMAAWSEQAFEACHYRYSKTQEHFRVPKNYRKHEPKNVLTAVNAWNATRLTAPEYTDFVSAGRCNGSLRSTDAAGIFQGPQVC